MQQISVNVPDEVAKLIKIMAKHSGQSESGLASQLLTPAIYEEASRRFKGMNFLKHAEKLETETEKPEP